MAGMVLWVLRGVGCIVGLVRLLGDRRGGVLVCVRVVNGLGLRWGTPCLLWVRGIPLRWRRGRNMVCHGWGRGRWHMIRSHMLMCYLLLVLLLRGMLLRSVRLLLLLRLGLMLLLLLLLLHMLWRGWDMMLRRLGWVRGRWRLLLLLSLWRRHLRSRMSDRCFVGMVPATTAIVNRRTTKDYARGDAHPHRNTTRRLLPWGRWGRDDVWTRRRGDCRS